MEEVFKTIPDFPDYLVSNFGRVKTRGRQVRYTHAKTGQEHFRNTEERFLKVHYNNLTGYKFYQLYRDKKMYNKNVHRLVASAFLPVDHGKDYVNHIDGNKHNNTVENLEWCTSAYNHEHAVKTGLTAKGSKVGTSKLTEDTVHAIKWFSSKGFNNSELARAFKISRPAVSLINTGRTWKHVALTGEELNIEL